MKQIAIILGREIVEYTDYGDSTIEKLIATGITDWSEVTDEDYDLLIKAQSYDYHDRFTVITRPSDEPTFAAKSVADYVVWAKSQDKKRQAERRKQEKEAEERKKKKEERSVASKRRQLEKLQKELGIK